VNNLLAVLFDGVVYSSWLFLMAAGLTLIYGVMKILNIARQPLRWGLRRRRWPALGSRRSCRRAAAMLVLAALLVGAVMGYCSSGPAQMDVRQDEVVLLLITYAAFLILEDVTADLERNRSCCPRRTRCPEISRSAISPAQSITSC
jgi:branched-chain amino acid transport system permease protein